MTSEEMCKRVVQAESEIAEVLAAMFEDFREHGVEPKQIGFVFDIRELPHTRPQSWKIGVDIELGATVVDKPGK